MQKFYSYGKQTIGQDDIDAVIDVLKRFRNVENLSVDKTYIDNLEIELTK